MTIQPGEIVPEIDISLTDGGVFELPEDLRKGDLTLLVVYRGLHCGICKKYLAELTAHADALSELGAEVVAVSSDTLEKARRAQAEWTGGELRFGYGLAESDGKLLRLFLSAKRKDGEPDRFFEPGMYLLDPAGKVLFLAVQNMPFGRPAVPEIVSRIEWMRENDVPPRGTLRY